MDFDDGSSLLGEGGAPSVELRRLEAERQGLRRLEAERQGLRRLEAECQGLRRPEPPPGTPPPGAPPAAPAGRPTVFLRRLPDGGPPPASWFVHGLAAGALSAYGATAGAALGLGGRAGLACGGGVVALSLFLAILFACIPRRP